MVRDFIELNDFVILLETSRSEHPIIDTCGFDEPIIAVAFYGSGNVDLAVKYGQNTKEFNNTKGIALSFYADDQVTFEHTVSANKPLESILIVTAARHLDNLPYQEGELFTSVLHQLVNPSDHYVEGPQFYMTPDMHTIVDQVFKNDYSGKTKMMFLRSQVTALLSHFFGYLSTTKQDGIKAVEREKLFLAKEILSSNLDTPPSLSELSKQIGLNSFKLKKNFKELFGVPVFKYLQNERLAQAYELLKKGELSIQETAWDVGYDSLSSFSNAFTKKYGFRPSQVS